MIKLRSPGISIESCRLSVIEQTFGLLPGLQERFACPSELERKDCGLFIWFLFLVGVANFNRLLSDALLKSFTEEQD